MTKRERAQVVELLRCCADVCAANLKDPDLLYTRHAVAGLGYDWMGDIVFHASKATQSVTRGAVRARSKPHFIYVCLEAAARVEEGSWP